MRVLPKWQDEWSDGCSMAPILNSRCRWACVRHDKAYYYGGSKADKKRADEIFHEDLIFSGVPKTTAYLYYLGVRTFGVPWLRIPNVSWAFGWKHFKYDAVPATEM